MNEETIVKRLWQKEKGRDNSRRMIGMSDEKIVEMFLQRDEAASERSKDRYGKRILGIAYDITLDRQTAEEVENDTYFQAWESIPPNTPYTYLFAFLARIARNLSLSFCRERSRLKRSGHLVELSEELEECVPSGESVEAELEVGTLADSISRFLYSQSKEKRQIFLRRYWFLDSVESIADRFNKKEGSVTTLLFRLRQELKAFMEREGYQV